MSVDDPFPRDLTEARDRFRADAERAGARVESWPLGIAEPGPDGEAFAIDAARLGPEDAGGLVLVSSGLHGVEAPLGSAVQSAWLGRPTGVPAGVAVAMLHVINPFGFAHDRRFDHENVDLNRNFPDGSGLAPECPDAYRRLDPLLNPGRPPGRFEASRFLPRALWAQLRLGHAAVKQAVAEGQAAFPRGLFFAGDRPSASVRVLEQRLPRLVGPSRRIVHLDIHTGLGPRGAHSLLIDAEGDSPTARRLAEAFGADVIAPSEPSGIAYRARGTFGAWCGRRFADRAYDYGLAEFGTEPPLAVLAALRLENMAHHHGRPDDPRTLRAKRRLREAFAPSSIAWRRAALADGLSLVERAIAAIGRDEEIGVDAQGKKMN